MTDPVAAHYVSGSDLAALLAHRLERAGKSLDALTPEDLAPVDQFHVGGREAILELADRMELDEDSHVLDIGAGLGGPARTVAAEFGCRVTGVDLTPAFCAAANALSGWLGLADQVVVERGDATDLPYPDHRFDAAMTVHVSMNVPDKVRLCEEARRVVKPGGVVALYDVLQGEGGEVLYPVPWARDPSISHMVTAEEMERLLEGAGFRVLEVLDSTEEGLRWFGALMARRAEEAPPPVSFRDFLGDDFSEMARNQARNLTDRRVRTVTFVCRA